MKYKPFNVNFDLGLNTKDSPKKIKDGECSICQDAYLDKSGSILTRKFKNNYMSFDVKPKTLFPYNNGLVIHLANGSLYNKLGNLIGSNYGSTPFYCVEYNGVLYLTNGLNKLRYDKIDVYNIGNSISNISSLISDSGIAGVLDGTYYYRYSYEDKHSLESNSSSISNGVAVSSKKMNVSIIPSSSNKVRYINIYRLGGTLTDWYYLDRVLNSTAISGVALSFYDADDQGNNATKVWADANFIYLANNAGGILSFSIDSSGTLTFIDSDASIVEANGVYGDGNFIYVANGTSGLYVYTSDVYGNLTQISSSYYSGTYLNVFAKNNFIYVAAQDTGVLIYTIDNNGILTFKSGLSFGYPVFNVCSDGKFVYIMVGATTDGKIEVYEQNLDGSLTWRDRYSLSGSALGIFVDDNFLYVAAGGEGLFIFSVNENGQLTLLDSDDQGDTAYSVLSDGNFVYLANGTGGLHLYSISDLGILTHVDSDDQGDSALYVFNHKSFILLANDTGGLLSYVNGYTYVDNIADLSLTVLEDNNNNDPPSNGLKFITEHYQRFIGAKTTDYPNSIEFTREFYPESWGNSLNQQYLLGGNDECTGLMSWGRFIVFFKKYQIYVMEGSDPTEWHRRRSDASKGNISPYALAFWKLPIFISYSGIHVFDGNLETKISDKIDSWFYNNRYYIPSGVGVEYENKYYFGIDNDETIVYDLRTGTFIIHKYGLTAICYDYINNILFGGVGTNVVKLEEDNNNNNADTVYFQIKSKAYPLHDVEGRLGELKDYIVQIDTKSEDVTFNIYIDDELKETKTLNTDHMKPVSGTFNALSGYYAEFEFVYTGTKRIQIDVPVIINQTRVEATSA